MLGNLKTLVAKEWLLLISFFGLVATSLLFRRIPIYSEKEFQVVLVLFAFFVTVKGLERSHVMLWVAGVLESGKYVEIKFVLVTFLLSMFVTNDVALIILVPVTLFSNIERKGLLIILEALAANTGSALTPFGNPQNLFIYWVYNVKPSEFILSIAPFSIFFLVCLSIAAMILSEKNNKKQDLSKANVKTGKKAYIYLALLIFLIFIILHFLPVYMVSIVFIYALLFDKESLKIDYGLLLTFLCFFGLADNLKEVFLFNLKNSANIFLYTAGISQIISNVPATLLLSKFTAQWDALLWGANVGGFGTLVASLANLIAYKLYISNDASKNKKVQFTLSFFLAGMAALLMGVGLYFMLKTAPTLSEVHQNPHSSLFTKGMPFHSTFVMSDTKKLTLHVR